jgi:hypothetical protein
MAAMAMVTPVIIILMAAINSITPVKPMPKTKVSVSQKTLAGLGILLCSGLLILSVPRFIASIYALYPEAVYNDARDTLTPEIYEKSLADLQQALFWNNNPDYLKKQSYFYLKLFALETLQTQAQKKARLTQAQTAIINSLALSPIDAYGWLQLAEIDEQLNQPKKQIIEALRLSFYAGRVEPELVISRLLLSYKYYPDFTQDMQKDWQKQVKVAWTFKAPQLLEFIARHPDAQAIALTAFANSPDEAAKFLNQVNKKK